MKRPLITALLLAAALPVYAQVPTNMGQSMVKKLDADGNGTLSEAEFTAPYCKRVKDEFAAMDTNHDGQVTAEEAQTAAEAAFKQMQQLRQQQVPKEK